MATCTNLQYTSSQPQCPVPPACCQTQQAPEHIMQKIAHHTLAPTACHLDSSGNEGGIGMRAQPHPLPQLPPQLGSCQLL